MSLLIELERHLCFSGEQYRFEHASETLQCDMKFSLFLPPQIKQQACPVLFWLSGLTCTDENFTFKAGAQRVAAELGLILAIPDTSPRGAHVPDDESERLGQGASFYVNATQAPWRAHYQMFDYISQEFPDLIHAHFPTQKKQSIAGHSMGGHGALMMALRHPKRFCSASAFAPVVNPTQTENGRAMLSQYLGSDEQAWQQYDSCYLLAHAVAENQLPILVDQGLADPLMPVSLQPKIFAQVAQQKNWPITVRFQEHYDHSYYFVASFIEEHLRFHAQYLFE
ncbi:S-formylglutathione hydrolase [Neisseria sp. Ec49-e6-T10]|uniref:S-formylglutathione hydrolase n=1 Tax=Neisseria sp. Ec49-e6-T10 TaxID=3140744 RepID=UPI003EB95CF4